MKPNQMKLFKSIAGLNLLIAPLALAQTGDHGGNGGDIITCASGPIRMLDTIEAIRAKTPPRFSAQSTTLRKKVDELLARQMRKDEYLGESLTQRAHEFLADIENFESTHEELQANTQFAVGELPNVPDEGYTFIPPGCKPEQLIIRTKDVLPNQKRYLVREDRWIHMSLDEKAIAILHESIYGHLIDMNVNNSPSARWYNGVLMSDQVTSIADQDLFKQMVAYHFYKDANPYLDNGHALLSVLFWKRTTNGYVYDPINGAEYESDGTFKSLKNVNLLPEAQIKLFANKETKIVRAKQIDFNHGSVTKVTEPGFNSNEIAFINGFSIKERQYVTLFPSVEFENGRFKSATLATETIDLDLNSGKEAPLEITYGGPQPTISAKSYSVAKTMNIAGIAATSVLEAEGNGYVLKKVRRYQWRLNKFFMIPLVGQMDLAILGFSYNQRYHPADLHLDSDLQVIKIDEQLLPWSKMGRY